MPRGFLVKRNRKLVPASYRLRSEEQQQQQEEEVEEEAAAEGEHQQDPRAAAASLCLVPLRADTRTFTCGALTSALRPVRFGNPDSLHQVLSSPTRPVSHDLSRSCRGSPASVESFPTPAAPLDRIFTPVDQRFCSRTNPRGCTASSSSSRGSRRPSHRTAAKKSKTVRKLHLGDDVTTSPVLGLRIKELPVDRKCTHQPLGEFVCQLCREAYGDPRALAQHRCSRIVRVDYRCPDCHKVFSCPANLASHRRWHKPMQQQQQQREATAAAASVKGARDQDTPSTGPPESGSKEAPSEWEHLVAQHGPPSDQSGSEEATGALLNPGASTRHVCPVCEERFSSRGSQERHIRLLHAANVFAPSRRLSQPPPPALSRHQRDCQRGGGVTGPQVQPTC